MRDRSDIDKRLPQRPAPLGPGFMAMAEAAPDAIITIDSTGRILFWNHAAEKIFGYEKKEIAGRSVVTLMPKRYRVAHRRGVKHFLATGEGHYIGQTVELEGLRKNGNEFPLELSLSAWSDQGETFITGIVRDITARRAIQTEIKHAARFLAENPFPVLRIAGDGKILYANAAAASLLGRWGVEVGGVAPRRWHQIAIKTLESNQVETGIEEEDQDKTLSFTAVPVAEAKYVNLYAHDVTERKQAEEEKEKLLHDLGERIKELDCLYFVARIVTNPDTSVAGMCQEIVDIIPPSWQYPEIATARIALGRQRCQSPDFKESKGNQRADILEHGHIIGTVEVNYREKRPEADEGPFLKEERDLIKNIAALLGGAIERRVLRQLGEGLNAVNTAVSSTLDLETILHNVAVEATKALGVDTAMVVMREDKEWRVSDVYKLPKKLIGMRFTDLEMAHAGWAVLTQAPIAVDDAYHDERVNLDFAKKYDIRSILTVPLTTRDEAIGALCFNHHSVQIPFTTAQIDFVTKMAASVALALENVQSYQTTEQSLNDAMALRRLSARFTQTLELDQILETGLNEILSALQIEHGGIYISDETGNLVLRRESQLSREFLEAKTIISWDAGCAGRAVATKEVFSPSKGEHDFACEDSKRLLGLDCLAAIPLVTKGSVLGVLELFAPAHRLLSDRERRIVATMADQLSAAIENANLYSTQRNIANALQETLLTVPEKIEGIHFGHLYRSATAEAARAGGDFYALFELEHNRLGILIGDVSGKGLEAASLTALVKDTIKAYAYQHASPAKVVGMTNNILVDSSGPSTFVTLFFGILDIESGVLLYCNAGHPQPMIRRQPSAISLLETGSPVIGVFTDLEYQDFEETLRENDILFLYTDGAIDARRDRELFGEERLVSLIKDLHATSVRELPERVFEKLFDFAQGTMADDTALLAISLENGAKTRGKPGNLGPMV